MKRFLVISSYLYFLILIGSGCSKIDDKKITFAFYNVENLFDTINNPQTKDDYFTPSGKNKWNTEKYHKKLDNIARVISSIQKNGLPDILALSEVENKKVVEDLLKTAALKKSGYKIIHKDGPDERGLDEALLYKPKTFNIISFKYIDIEFPVSDLYKNTYILYAKGLTHEGDTLHLFINHWISRWKGKEKTEIFRILTANKIKSMVDDILINTPNANIIIAGDFNDNPDDKSISSALKALKPKRPLKKQTLYNLAAIPYEKGEGTVFNGKWDMFDQIIVSTSMLTGVNGVQVNSASQTIIKYDWMLRKENGVKIPYRTYTNKYLGGYSDHLPVYIEINVNNKKDLSSII